MKEAVDAALAFSKEGEGMYLSHPKVRPYLGTANGDSPEAWHRDYIEALCKVIVAAPRPEVATTKLTAEEVERLVNLRPGPIKVVYPLDEEWDKAIDAAIEECWRLEDRGKTDHRKSWMGNAAHAILLLRRSPQSQRQEDK
mgnify:CR=1 FL=1